MPDAQSTMAPREKKHYGLLQKTVPENNHKTQCRCVCHVSLYLAWVHTGNTFQSLILGLYRCSSSPCRYRGAGWIPGYCPRTHCTRAGTCTSYIPVFYDSRTPSVANLAQPYRLQSTSDRNSARVNWGQLVRARSGQRRAGSQDITQEVDGAGSQKRNFGYTCSF